MFNLIRSVFHFFVLKNVYKYILILLLFISSIALFTPIIQVELQIQNAQKNIIKKSGSFQVKYTLPSKKEFKILQKRNLVFEKNLSLEEIIDNLLKNNRKKYNLNFHYFQNKVAKYTDFKNKKDFFVQIGFQDDSKINKVVLSEGRKPRKDKLEVVLNKKFAELNDIRLGQHIVIFKKRLQVVGFGETVQNLSLAFIDTFATLSKFGYKSGEVNLYEKVGLVYLRKDFFDLMEKNEIIKDYNQFLFLDFLNEKNLKKLNPLFLDSIYKKINFLPKEVLFKSDPASGLKQNFSFLELIFLACIIFIFIISLVFSIIKLSKSSFQDNKSKMNFLYFQGYSRYKLSFCFFLIVFITFLFATLCGYFIGFFLNDYFSESNNELFFTSIKSEVLNWNFFLILIFFFPLFFASVSFFAIFLNFHKKTIVSKYNLAKVWRIGFFMYLYNWMKLKLISVFLFAPRFKIFILFLFRDAWYKLITLIFVVFLFIMGFFVLFTKIASDNFLYNQMAFLDKGVKSVTNLKGMYGSAYLESRNNFIQNDLLLSSYDEMKKNKKIKPITDLNINSIFDKDTNYSCFLKGTGQNIAQKPELDCLALNKFIDSTNVRSKTVRTYLKLFGIQSIYFNRLPYDKKLDLPLLLLNFYMNDIKGSTYFLRGKWRNFFNLSHMSSKLPDWKLTFKNGKYFLGKDPKSGIFYALVPKHFENFGYKLGDIIKQDLFLNRQKLSYKSDSLETKHKFKIAGFVKDKFIINNTIFVDYDYLLEKNFINNQLKENQRPFNIIFSKHNKKHILRNLVVNLSLNTSEELEKSFKGKVDLNDFLLLNLESLTLKEIKNFSGYHFKIFQVYLIIMIVFVLVIIFAFLLLMLEFFHSKNHNINSFLLKIGYSIKDLIFVRFLFFLFLLSLASLLSFGASYYIFAILTDYFGSFGIFFVVSDMWNYLGYFVLCFFFILIIDLFYNFIHLKLKILK